MKQRTDKHPTDWREGRRFRAWELAQQGWKQKNIAVALGVSQGAVSQWLKRARADGHAAMRRQPPPGRQPKLTPEQLAPLPALLKRGPEAWRFRMPWRASAIEVMCWLAAFGNLAVIRALLTNQ